MKMAFQSTVQCELKKRERLSSKKSSPIATMAFILFWFDNFFSTKITGLMLACKPNSFFLSQHCTAMICHFYSFYQQQHPGD
jgi:hypothetical protein